MSKAYDDMKRIDEEKKLKSERIRKIVRTEMMKVDWDPFINRVSSIIRDSINKHK